MPHKHVSSTALALRQDLQFTGIGRFTAHTDCTQGSGNRLATPDSRVGIDTQIGAQCIRDIDAARRYARNGFSFENFHATNKLIKPDHKLVAMVAHLSHDKLPVGIGQTENPAVGTKIAPRLSDSLITSALGLGG